MIAFIKKVIMHHLTKKSILKLKQSSTLVINEKCKHLISNGKKVYQFGFEMFLDNIKQPKKSLKDQKTKNKFSDFQKSERDFAFILDKDFQVQELIEIISNVDKNLIKSVKVFDVYEGKNIPENKKSIALNVTIQSSEKTLNEDDLNKINQTIITAVESKLDAKIRS